MNEESLSVARDIIQTLDPYGVLEIENHLLPKSKKIINPYSREVFEYPYDLFEHLKDLKEPSSVEKFLKDRDIPFKVEIHDYIEENEYEVGVYTSFRGIFANEFKIITFEPHPQDDAPQITPYPTVRVANLEIKTLDTGVIINTCSPKFRISIEIFSFTGDMHQALSQPEKMTIRLMVNGVAVVFEPDEPSTASFMLVLPNGTPGLSFEQVREMVRNSLIFQIFS